jgi:hypothetical protein
MEGEVGDEEPLVCYVVERNKLKSDGVHWKGFLPSPDGERSVFRSLDLTAAEIAELGVREVAQPRGKTLYGWGTLTASQVRQKLPVKKDEPPDRHAVIAPWPGADDEVEAIAMHYASLAVVHRVNQ